MKDQSDITGENSELRNNAEAIALKGKAEFEKALEEISPEKARLLLHELHVHQIELQMQNDELRKTQGELEASRARYFDLYDLAPVGYCNLNRDGILLEANLTAANLLGVTRNTMVNRPFSNFVAREYQDVYYHFRKLFVKREIAPAGVSSPNDTVELRMTRQDAKPFWARLEVKAAKNADGSIGYRVLLSDISERIGIEAENLRLERENQQHRRLESLGTLAAGIAHDFNNLLTGIFGNIELAQREVSNDPAADYLATAMTALTRSRALTGQLLTFAKGGAPVQKLDHLFPFVQESALFALSGSNVRCKFDIAEGLWPCSFDVNQIGRVIDNLVRNAQQSMPDGGEVALSARNVALKENEKANLPAGNYVQISVSDSGTGIPPELLPRIFDPFFTTKANSHGLGLATCYSILKRHGGHIEAESNPAGGAVFHVYLSAVKEVIVISNPPEEDLKPGAGGIVVVMDDDDTIRKISVPILKSLGYEAVTLKDGQAAVDFYQTAFKGGQKISAMIFDLTIPGGMGGKDAVAQIRKFDPNIPVFVCSGYAEDPAMANPGAYGFTASMPKPFRVADLALLLTKYCPT